MSIELINLSQELNAIHINKIALINKLKSLTHSELGEHTNFIMPSSTVLDAQDQVRYEYKLLSKKQQQLESSKSLLDSKTKPMLFAFATAGLGKPGLNMLSNQFDDFYMVGLNLKWDLWDWNKTKKDKKMVDISKAIIETQKQAFEMNIQLGILQIQSEIDKHNALIIDDPKIIVLRENILQAAEAQFRNGSIRSSDYVMELQKLTQAKLNYEIHKITLLSAQLAYTEILGKL